MSMTERIYAWLLTQGGPRTIAEIAAALGISRDAAQATLFNAKRRGRIVPDGWRGWVPGRPPLSKEEAAQRSIESTLAKLQGREAKERMAARAKLREAKREFEQAQRKRNTATDRAIVANHRARVELQAAPKQFQSVAEYLANGGKVERLEPFAVSPASQFKRIKVAA